MRAAAWTYLIGLTCMAAGCATEVLAPPRLTEVCRGAYTGPCVDWVYAGETSDVTLRGDQLHHSFVVDLGHDRSPAARGQFSALVGGVAVEQIKLGPRTEEGQYLLTGNLPGTLPVGLHQAELTTPDGQMSLLPDAFRVANPLHLEMVNLEPQIPRGAIVQIPVHLENRGSAQLTDLTLELTQEGPGMFELPNSPEPLVLDGSQSLRVDLYPLAIQEGAVALSLQASALANETVPLSRQEPYQLEFLVLAPSILSVVAEARPATVQEGQRFELMVDVVNQGGTPALEVEVLPPRITGTGGVEMDLPAPQVQNIPVGIRRRFHWGAMATQQGSVAIEVGVSGQEAISGRILDPANAPVVSLEIQ